MKVIILYGSHKKQGNTYQMTVPFINALKADGAEVSEEWLCDYDIRPCRGCGVCQEHLGEIGCVHDDDFVPLFERICSADIMVFAVPIYAASAPGHVKIFIDRLIYSAIKLYGTEKAPSMLAGKACAALITSGADPKRMIIPFEITLSTLSYRLELDYLGWVGGTDPGKKYIFMNEKKAQRSEAFAYQLLSDYAKLHSAGNTGER